MTEHNISSLPVVNFRGKVIGILELSKLVNWISLRLNHDPTTAALTDVIQARAEMRKARVNSLMDTSWVRFLYHAGELLVQNEGKPVIVTNWQGNPRGILTQSMLIGEIFNNLSIIPAAIKKMKVKDITKTYWVDMVLEDSLTIAAFRSLTNYGRHGMAVVNNEGALVDELSAKDLRGVDATSKSFLNLYQTVKEFKKVVREKARKPIPPIAKVTQKNTLEDVIRLMDQGPTAR